MSPPRAAPLMDHRETTKRVDALLAELRGPLLRAHAAGLPKVETMVIVTEALSILFAVEVLVQGNAPIAHPDTIPTAATIIRSFPWERSIRVAVGLMELALREQREHH